MNLCHQEDIQKLTTQELFQQHNYIYLLFKGRWMAKRTTLCFWLSLFIPLCFSYACHKGDRTKRL